jgi:hypothetical protein
MRKFVGIAIVVCLSIAAAPAVLSGLLSLRTSHRTAQVERFYQEHRLFGEIRAVQNGSTNDSGPAREVLLQILPLGTDREAAVAVLGREGLDCQTITEPITDTRVAPTLPNGSWPDEYPERPSDTKRLRRLSSDDPQFSTVTNSGS